MSDLTGGSGCRSGSSLFGGSGILIVILIIILLFLIFEMN